MSMVLRSEYVKRKRDELRLMVSILREVYPDVNTLENSIKRQAIFDEGMQGLKKNPRKVLEVFLPIIRSYGEQDFDFQIAVDALLKDGVFAFYEELRKIQIPTR